MPYRKAPLRGDTVRFIDLTGREQSGMVVDTHNFRDLLGEIQGERKAREFVARCRAAFGNDHLMDFWTADVQLPDGTIVAIEPRQIQDDPNER